MRLDRCLPEPGSALFGAGVAFLVMSLTSGQWSAPGGAVAAEEDAGFLVSAEEKFILSHFSIPDHDADRATIIRLSRANLQLTDGTGTTRGELRGTGNLILGYNEQGTVSSGPDARRGSHNLVIGTDLAYTGNGGIVTGTSNRIESGSVVLGGAFNVAEGLVLGGRNNQARGGIVLGGARNLASGGGLVVSGRDNIASSLAAVVVAGESNTAMGTDSVVLAGRGNLALGPFAVVGAGQNNQATGTGAVVVGGSGNVSSGKNAVVSGGAGRSAVGEDDWVAGSLFEDD